MFDVGFWELVLIFFIALMVLGPESLPRVANRVGAWVGNARAIVRNLRAQIEAEITEKDRKTSASAGREPAGTRGQSDEAD